MVSCWGAGMGVWRTALSRAMNSISECVLQICVLVFWICWLHLMLCSTCIACHRTATSDFSNFWNLIFDNFCDAAQGTTSNQPLWLYLNVSSGNNYTSSHHNHRTATLRLELQIQHYREKILEASCAIPQGRKPFRSLRKIKLCLQRISWY